MNLQSILCTSISSILKSIILWATLRCSLILQTLVLQWGQIYLLWLWTLSIWSFMSHLLLNDLSHSGQEYLLAYLWIWLMWVLRFLTEMPHSGHCSFLFRWTAFRCFWASELLLNIFVQPGTSHGIFYKKSRIRAFSTFGHENGKVLSKKNPETIPSLTCPSERDKDRH